MSVKSSVRVSISIHALVKRATEGAKFVLLTFAISIHALVKRATYIFDKDGNVYDFNPRPRKEGDIYKSTRTSKGANFNPRPRKEGDYRLVSRASISSRISIHALAKRATLRRISDTLCRIISIHALAKRATGRYVYFERLSSDFNPRPRKEGDPSILRAQ